MSVDADEVEKALLSRVKSPRGAPPVEKVEKTPSNGLLLKVLYKRKRSFKPSSGSEFRFIFILGVQKPDGTLARVVAFSNNCSVTDELERVPEGSFVELFNFIQNDENREIKLMRFSRMNLVDGPQEWIHPIEETPLRAASKVLGQVYTEKVYLNSLSAVGDFYATCAGCGSKSPCPACSSGEESIEHNFRGSFCNGTDAEQSVILGINDIQVMTGLSRPEVLSILAEDVNPDQLFDLIGQESKFCLLLYRQNLDSFLRLERIDRIGT